MSDRSITVRIATSKAGFTLAVSEQETIANEDSGGAHTEKEVSSQDFAMFRTAAEAAVAVVKQFEQKLKAPAGELFE